MSEWLSVLTVFWVLWGVDGLRLMPVPWFGVIGGRRKATLAHARLLRPGWAPTGWRATVADIPFALSPAGICNRPAGCVGRPVDGPGVARAWAWAEVREVAAKDGWLVVNGLRFCRDTGHLRAGQLLALAQMDGPARERRIEWWLSRWLRPAHLRRRARVLVGRTGTLAMVNALLLGIAVAITVYLEGNLADRLPARWLDAVARLLPLLAGYLVLLHVTAVVLAWRMLRRLKAVTTDKRGIALLSAALLPPQALRLRALVGEAYFPPQHPLAYAVAFARKGELAELAFQALGDLRWPVGGEADPPQAREIVAWFTSTLAGRLGPMVRAAGVDKADLFRAPLADSESSCSYCPRCRGQFIAGPVRCLRGIELLPVARR